MSHVLEHGGLELPNFDYDVGLLLSQPFYMPKCTRICTHWAKWICINIVFFTLVFRSKIADKVDVQVMGKAWKDKSKDGTQFSWSCLQHNPQWTHWDANHYGRSRACHSTLKAIASNPHVWIWIRWSTPITLWFFNCEISSRYIGGLQSFDVEVRPYA